MVCAVFNSRVHTARVSGSLLGRKTKRTDRRTKEEGMHIHIRDDSRFRFLKGISRHEIRSRFESGQGKFANERTADKSFKQSFFFIR